MRGGNGPSEGWAARMLEALAARPAGTTVSRPVRRRTVWGAALAARPIMTAARAQRSPSPDTVTEGDVYQAGALLEQVRRALADTIAVHAEGFDLRAGADVQAGDGPPVHVRIAEQPLRVEVRYPVLADVTESDTLHARLSKLSTARPDARYTYTGGTIWASAQIPGVDFQPAHLGLAVEQVTRAAPAVAVDLQAEFGGTLPHASRRARPTTAPVALADRGVGPPRRTAAPLYAQMGVEVTPQWFVVGSYHYPVEELANLRMARGPLHPYTIHAATLSGIVLLTTAAVLGLVGGAALYAYTFVTFAAGLAVPVIAVPVGDRIWRRSWELWADYFSITVRLFVTDSERQFGQVTRALLRAQEIARLGSAADLDDLDVWRSWRRVAVRRDRSLSD